MIIVKRGGGVEKGKIVIIFRKWLKTVAREEIKLIYITMWRREREGNRGTIQHRG